MLHHVSFNARDPRRAATVIAQLVGGTALPAPVPPFPAGSWFVCRADDAGTMLEVLPWGTAVDPETAWAAMAEPVATRTGTHVLMSTPLGTEAITELAAREGWTARPANAGGLFQLTKVWVENTFLLELMTPAQARDYVAVFGRDGANTLDATLRRLERTPPGAAAA